MRTIVIEVSSLFSALSARGVEKQLVKLAGVDKVEVNYVAGSATVVYDESVIELKTIKAKVHECGYHCAGERLRLDGTSCSHSCWSWRFRTT